MEGVIPGKKYRYSSLPKSTNYMRNGHIVNFALVFYTLQTSTAMYRILDTSSRGISLQQCRLIEVNHS